MCTVKSAKVVARCTYIETRIPCKPCPLYKIDFTRVAIIFISLWRNLGIMNEGNEYLLL